MESGVVRFNLVPHNLMKTCTCLCVCQDFMFFEQAQNNQNR